MCCMRVRFANFERTLSRVWCNQQLLAAKCEVGPAMPDLRRLAGRNFDLADGQWHLRGAAEFEQIFREAGDLFGVALAGGGFFKLGGTVGDLDQAGIGGGGRYSAG